MENQVVGFVIKLSQQLRAIDPAEQNTIVREVAYDTGVDNNQFRAAAKPLFDYKLPHQQVVSYLRPPPVDVGKRIKDISAVIRNDGSIQSVTKLICQRRLSRAKRSSRENLHVVTVPKASRSKRPN
jgi:hypothetical protein